MALRPKSRMSRRLFGLFSLASFSIAESQGQSADNAAGSGDKIEPLPPFTFDLAHSPKGWSGKGGSSTEANTAVFPLSESIAGVLMTLKPGGLRELHWHADAAEWAYIIKGRCRVTVISPNGQADWADFEPGDTWYFPRGHGHSLQGLGPDDCQFLLGFDNGRFSEFGTFSISDWVSRTPTSVLTRNLKLPAGEFSQFPKGEVYIVPGKVPPPFIDHMRNPNLDRSQLSHKYPLASQPPVFTVAGSTLRFVSSKEFPIQTTLTSAQMELQPGALREMHWHPNADEWQYCVSGRARVTEFASRGRVRSEEIGPGQIAFIQQGFGHFVEEISGGPTQIVILFNSPVYEEITISEWLGGNPGYVLSDNFEIPENLVKQLPRHNLKFIPRS
jgi:oxalate decarboxylase